MIRFVSEYRSAVSSVVAGAVWIAARFLAPFPSDNPALALVLVVRHFVYHTIEGLYVVMWFTTPFIAMSMTRRHSEGHKIGVGGWLRAAVLGANDGVVSISSLVVGVAAADSSTGAIFTAGLVVGALLMAVGEYVSVSSQRDVEVADLQRERQELREQPEHELSELTALVGGKRTHRGNRPFSSPRANAA